MKKINIILIFVILILSAIYFISRSISDTKDMPVEPAVQTQTENTIERQIEINEEQARELVIQTWGECSPDTCGQLIVTTEKIDEIIYVTATYDKLYDDSVRAERRVAEVRYIDDVWVLGDFTLTHSCQKGRGHEDFSNELCL